MRLSAKTEYACVAMIALASGFSAGEPVRIRNIADEHGIPARFLVQILLQLKGAGLVISTRGAAGGYQLAKSPQQISLGDVMEVIEGPDDLPASCVAKDSRAARALRETWREVTRVENKMLRAVSLADLLERTRRQGEPMYYI